MSISLCLGLFSLGYKEKKDWISFYENQSFAFIRKNLILDTGQFQYFFYGGI